MHRAKAYHEIAEGQLRVGDTAAALRSLEAAEAAASQIADRTFSSLAFDDVTKDFDAVAKAKTVAGDRAAAQETLRAAKAFVANSRNQYSQASAYCAIAKRQAKAGDLAGARETIKTAKALAAGPDNGEADALIVDALATVGDIENAKALARRMKYEEYTAMAFSNIADVQLEAGDLAGAKSTASQIEDQRSKAFAYLAIAEAQAKTGSAAALATRWQRPRRPRRRSKTGSTRTTCPGGMPAVESQRRRSGSADVAGAKATAAQIQHEIWKWKCALQLPYSKQSAATRRGAGNPETGHGDRAEGQGCHGTGHRL